VSAKDPGILALVETQIFFFQGKMGKIFSEDIVFWAAAYGGGKSPVVHKN
jgi:hypothetical protein